MNKSIETTTTIAASAQDDAGVTVMDFRSRESMALFLKVSARYRGRNAEWRRHNSRPRFERNSDVFVHDTSGIVSKRDA